MQKKITVLLVILMILSLGTMFYAHYLLYFWIPLTSKFWWPAMITQWVSNIIGVLALCLIVLRAMRARRLKLG